jgi:hypothetical protein
MLSGLVDREEAQVCPGFVGIIGPNHAQRVCPQDGELEMHSTPLGV